jgi:glycine/D-amino acid oxidase-like deaminating enzyme
MHKTTDIAVIGAGAIGAATSYYLAKRGYRVLLIDAGDLASLTSSRCDGNVLAGDKRSVYEASMTMRSQNLFDELTEELGYDFEWERRGSMLVMESEAEMEMARRLCDEVQQIGMPSHIMDQKELRTHEPYIAEDILGGIWFDRDGCLYPMGLCYALAEGIKRLNGELLLHCPVTGIEKSGEGFLLHTAQCDVYAAKIVNCAGIKAPHIGAMVGLSIPIRPRQGHLIVSEQSFKISRQKVMEFGYMMAKFPGQQDYKRSVTPLMEKYGVAFVFEPTGSDNFLLGSSRYFTEEDDLLVEIDILRAIAQRGIRFYPVLQDIKVVRTYAGIRGYTPDHKPIVSETPIPGFYCACGHEGDGIGLSAITGVLMSQLIAGEKPEFDLTPLRLDRFETMNA